MKNLGENHEKWYVSGLLDGFYNEYQEVLVADALEKCANVLIGKEEQFEYVFLKEGLCFDELQRVQCTDQFIEMENFTRVEPIIFPLVRNIFKKLFVNESFKDIEKIANKIDYKEMIVDVARKMEILRTPAKLAFLYSDWEAWIVTGICDEYVGKYMHDIKKT